MIYDIFQLYSYKLAYLHFFYVGYVTVNDILQNWLLKYWKKDRWQIL